MPSFAQITRTARKKYLISPPSTLAANLVGAPENRHRRMVRIQNMPDSCRAKPTSRSYCFDGDCLTSCRARLGLSADVSAKVTCGILDRALTQGGCLFPVPRFVRVEEPNTNKGPSVRGPFSRLALSGANSSVSVGRRYGSSY